MKELRLLRSVAIRLGVTLLVEWIPTEENVEADRLSRTLEWLDAEDWSLSVKVRGFFLVFYSGFP